MKIENKIQKQINTIITATKEYPKEIEITEAEYNYLKDKNLLINNMYLNVYLKIK